MTANRRGKIYIASRNIYLANFSLRHSLFAESRVYGSAADGMSVARANERFDLKLFQNMKRRDQ
jgi:hypothetical protein